MALVALASLLLGCSGHPIQRKLEGRWIGQEVENVREDLVAQATGWAKGASFEFSGSAITVAVTGKTLAPASIKSPRSIAVRWTCGSRTGPARSIHSRSGWTTNTACAGCSAEVEPSCSAAKADAASVGQRRSVAQVDQAVDRVLERAALNLMDLAACSAQEATEGASIGSKLRPLIAPSAVTTKLIVVVTWTSTPASVAVLLPKQS